MNENKIIGTIHNKEYVIVEAEVEDAPMLLSYLKASAAESKFLLREADEITLSLEAEESYLKTMKQSNKDVMLLMKVDHHLVGVGSINQISSFQRMQHRCEIAIALLQPYWGQHYGSILFENLLEQAQNMGYEQVELQVVVDNVRALSLYQKYGFVVCGRIMHAMKYKDGSYVDEYQMIKQFDNKNK